MKKNEKGILVICPQCSNKDKFPIELADSVSCAKCGAKLLVKEMTCFIGKKDLKPQWGETARWEEFWLRSKDAFVFDLTPLTEQVDDEEQATREENIVCPICEQEVKVKVQPAYQLTNKGRKKMIKKGWLVIGINSVVWGILFSFPALRSDYDYYHSSSFIWLLLFWAAICLVGVYYFTKAAPGKVFSSSMFISEASESHKLLRPGQKVDDIE